MASIIEVGVPQAKPRYLYADHLVGRKPGSHLQIDLDAVSSTHAVFRWIEPAEGAPHWIVRDLGSRNGTFVNGRCLESGKDQKISPGDEIAFAESQATWSVVDLEQPRPLLIIDGAAAPVPLDRDGQMFVHPSIEAPEFMVYRDGLRWRLEFVGQPAVPLETGARFETPGGGFAVHLAEPAATTRPATAPPVARKLENADLALHPSPDEERASFQVAIGPHKGHSGDARVPLYLLVLLAEVRLRDTQRAEAGEDERNLGWVSVDQAMQELGLSTDIVLGGQVFKCRAALRELDLVDNPAAIIDKSRKGWLRIGVPASRLRVVRPWKS